ncbi:MAG TPA: aminomethyl-transferring glycine dehydrogenase subunit GcvPA [Spirochaetota bacterium]|mgnify:CR=1 FL=1|nr:aminomethyl-transferring glycine dehydrogenase subunit GcvPA [Spirochaetota bacterium]
MTYFPHNKKNIDEMLSFIGKKSLNDLASPIPENLQSHGVDLPEGKPELEISNYFDKLGKKNKPYEDIFLGAGAYNHFIPSTVSEIAGRQEFYTAYTPYQAEISQGTLQTIFEYQTYIANLTGMDVSNASMYDGGTSLAEACVIATSSTRKNKLLVDKFVNPDYVEVLKTYMSALNIEIEIYESQPFSFDIENFNKKWNKDYAAFVIASPNFFGSILDYSKAVETVKSDKSLIIHSVSEIMSLSVLKSPGTLGADIACGEAQSFGIPLSFGGPYLGFLSCKKDYLRKMPGRIVGQAKDRDGNICYTLTLTAREQHIRRELATSNICSNHGLNAACASIYLSTVGRRGLRQCGLSNVEKSRYLFEKISKLEKFKVETSQAFFNEFVVKTSINSEKIKDILEKNNILSFLPMKDFIKGYDDYYLLCATEMNTKESIDKFVDILGGLQ